MAWLKDPIDVAEYARLYIKHGQIDPEKKLIRFSQSKDRYKATWQSEDFQQTLAGNPVRLREWMLANP